MSIIRQLTEAESDQIWLESLILRMAEATHHLAATAVSVNAEFWSTLNTERLIALLNADVARSLSILSGNTSLAGPVNASLDSIDLARFSHRAPTEPGRSDITFDGKQFVYVAPAPVVEAPEPLPEA